MLIFMYNTINEDLFHYPILIAFCTILTFSEGYVCLQG
jgi:hypothetical protein